MARYRMRVRRVVEEVLSVVVEADSDVKAHGKAEATKNFPDADVVSASQRTSVVACHRIPEDVPDEEPMPKNVRVHVRPRHDTSSEESLRRKFAPVKYLIE